MIFKSLFVWLVSISVAAAQSAASPAASDRPNILFFLVDDMGVFETSVPFLHDLEGKPVSLPTQARYRTPNIERLAASGMRFSNARAFSDGASTRVAVLTGQHPARLHICSSPRSQDSTEADEVDKARWIEPAWQSNEIIQDQPTLPRLLESIGYQTIHCDKDHLGMKGRPAEIPLRSGFSETLTREFIAALTASVRDAKAPFFAWMSHPGLRAPNELDSRTAENYSDLKAEPLARATMVEDVDQSLGDLLDTLELLGIASKSLVVFYSDNGSGVENSPLLGKKGTRFDGGSRVPMIVAWAKPDPNEPLQVRWPVLSGAVEDDLVTPMDFLPTLARMAGVKSADANPADARDIGPYLRGTPGTHRPQRFAVHCPDDVENGSPFTTWVDGSWKLIYLHKDRAWQLTNVAFDPGEARNMVAERPQLALAMARKMIEHLNSMKARWPLDKASGQPVLPNLLQLENAFKSNQAKAPAAPFGSDDLNLAKMIQPVTDDNLFREAEWYTWCNDIIRGDDGLYHLFYVRWPKQHGFYGWLTHSEIARAVSDRPAGPYKFVEVVLPSRGDCGWNQITAHNVKILRDKGKYYLYFISTNDGGRCFTEADLAATAKRGYSHPNWAVLRNNQRTGVAVAEHIEGPWSVQTQPVVEPTGPISTVTVNPAVWKAGEQSFMMIIKGDYPPTRVAQGIGVARSPDGPFRMLEPLAFDRYSEDVSVWQDAKRGLYYGVLHDSKGFGVIASRDGLEWRDARNYRASGKQVPLASGGSLKPTRFERPMVFADADGAPLVLCGAAQFNHGKDAYIVLIPLAQKP